MDIAKQQPVQSGPSLKVVGLVKIFDELKAVDQLTLEVGGGQVVALLGPNGSGKTTFMRMITGLLRPDGGTVEIFGKTGRQLDLQRSGLMGYCPQRLIIWRDLTCFEQLLFVSDMYGIDKRQGTGRVEYLLELFDIHKKRNELAAHLSGGMQRRLSMAVSMIHNPDILVLDEPEAGLDPQSRILIRRILRSFATEDGKTIIVSSHDMGETERIADTVAIIDKGRLLAMAPPDQLKVSYGSPSLIELSLPGLEKDLFEAAVARLSTLCPAVKTFDDHILLDSDTQGALMRPVRTVLSRMNITPREIRLRQRSLEDVFMDLTGRRLRQ